MMKIFKNMALKSVCNVAEIAEHSQISMIQPSQIMSSMFAGDALEHYISQLAPAQSEMVVMYADDMHTMHGKTQCHFAEMNEIL